MPIQWHYHERISLGKGDKDATLISPADAQRQEATAREILKRLRTQPGLLLADDVGMGKTYVTMAVIASVIEATNPADGPVIVMTPPTLRQKWLADWNVFRELYWKDGPQGGIQVESADTPTKFFRLLDAEPEKAGRLIFINTGLFSRSVTDSFIRLAFLRIARSKTKLSHTARRRLHKWAPILSRSTSNTKLKDVIPELMETGLDEWNRLLRQRKVPRQGEEEPIPRSLVQLARNMKDGQEILKTLIKLIRNLPAKAAPEDGEVQGEFDECFRELHGEWVRLTKWRSPLLVLDEAHHAKNDSTILAQLFREETKVEIPLLRGKCDRMLFLTATPFQLEHRELVNILDSFSAVRWEGQRAPSETKAEFREKLKELEEALNRYQEDARSFNRLWARLEARDVSPGSTGSVDEKQIMKWWSQIVQEPTSDEWVRLTEAYDRCCKSRQQAQELLRPWVIRHSRPAHQCGLSKVPRREYFLGRDVLDDRPWEGCRGVEGLEIPLMACLPFLIASRAQSQLEQSPGARALFAEGLVSSYEAFHHTKDNRSSGEEDSDSAANVQTREWVIPTGWYEERIKELIPSRQASARRRMEHPKVKATIEKVLKLWMNGEKVLVFCRYRQTARALRDHLSREVHRQVICRAGEKMKLPKKTSRPQVEKYLRRFVRLLSTESRPVGKKVKKACLEVLNRWGENFPGGNEGRLQIYNILKAYLRSESYIARFLPLDDPNVRRVIRNRRSSEKIEESAAEAIKDAIQKENGGAQQSFKKLARSLLRFADELARLPKAGGGSGNAKKTRLQEYLEAVINVSKPGHTEDGAGGVPIGSKGGLRYRIRPLVACVTGTTKPEVRNRVMQGFNSPLFPEILICTPVMGEGVDLHRFCRHVIHHDLDWNPCVLEQRTGRVDRLRSWAEVTGTPIRVYELFLAGSADEKMFRVVRDRERWFNIVMGQDFRIDEATSAEIARRIPLPVQLARELIMDLSCWKGPAETEV